MMCHAQIAARYLRATDTETGSTRTLNWSMELTQAGSAVAQRTKECKISNDAGSLWLSGIEKMSQKM